MYSIIRHSIKRLSTAVQVEQPIKKVHRYLPIESFVTICPDCRGSGWKLNDDKISQSISKLYYKFKITNKDELNNLSNIDKQHELCFEYEICKNCNGTGII